MDVTCNRCGTVYEFDEGLISTTGTTVKCTQCGHLFKVHRTVSSAAPAPDEATEEGPRKWRVRRVDGSTHTLDSLVELSGLVAAGQFQRDDEISRSGQVWKRLGEITELATLFEGPARPRRLSEPPPEPRLDTSSSRAPTGAPAREPVTTTATDTTSTDRMRRPSPPEQPLEEVAVEVEVDLEAGTQPMQPIGDAERANDTSPKANQRVPIATDAPAEDDALPSAAAPERSGSRALLWSVLLGIPLLIAGGVAGALFVRAHQRQAHEEPVPAFLRQADQALASHRPTRFDEAIREYEKALAFHGDDPHILSSISRVYAVWSQELRFRAQALRSSAGLDTDTQNATARAEARRLADQAKLYGERAAQRNPGNEEAGVALSDALRLNANLVAARAELDRARATQGMPEAETLRVAALLAIDEADGDLNAGRALAQQAVSQDASSLRNRALLARCLIAGGDFEGARAQLAAVSKLDPGHPMVAEITAELDPTSAQKPREEPGRQPIADTIEPTPTPSGSTLPAEPTPARVEPKAEQRSKDPLELTRLGEAALERGAVQTAERDFQLALELDPRSARAKTGLGYVALERGEPELAASHFRPAARDGRAEALIGLGDAYRRLGRIRDALDAYQAYLRRYPNGTRSSIAKRQSELLSEQLADGAR